MGASHPCAGPTVFVLSGGGNQAVSQVGMLRALFEHGIRPDVVIGTSAGALNGAAIAHRPDMAAVDHLEGVWRSIKSTEIFPGNRFTRAWNILRRGPALITSDGLAALIEATTSARSFADLVIPLRVVACDLKTGEEIVFCRGPLTPALMASAALPGIFPPVAHQGRLLVDGGVVNSVPLAHAAAGDAARVFILNVSGGGRSITHDPRSPLDVVMRSFSIARNQRFELELRHLRLEAEVTILPRPSDERELLDFSGADRLIEESYRLATEVLDRDEPVEVPVKDRRRHGFWRRHRAA